MEELGIGLALLGAGAAAVTMPPAVAIIAGGAAGIVCWRLGRRVRSRWLHRKEMEAQARSLQVLETSEEQRVHAYRLEQSPRNLALSLEDRDLSRRLLEFMSLVEHWRCHTEDSHTIDVKRNRRSITAVQGICLGLLDGCDDAASEIERLSLAVRRLSGQLADQLVRSEQSGEKHVAMTMTSRMPALQA
jgi:hypothetical protein